MTAGIRTSRWGETLPREEVQRLRELNSELLESLKVADAALRFFADSCHEGELQRIIDARTTIGLAIAKAEDRP